MNILQVLILFTLISILTRCNGMHINSETTTFINKTYEFGKTYTFSLNNAVDYIFMYSMSEQFYEEFPTRLSVTSYDALVTNPVFITAKQEKGVSSWQLPLVIDNWEMTYISRTMCPNKHILLNYFEGRKGHDSYYPVFQVSTSSVKNVTVQLRIDYVLDFNLEFNAVKKVTVSPARPLVYFYSFMEGIMGVDDNEVAELVDGTDSDNFYQKQMRRLKQFTARIKNSVVMESKPSVLLHITSDDDTCMLISIQNVTCPIFDTERELKYEGFYATISRQGGISVTRRKYPNGFYVVLVVQTDDTDCTGQPSNDVRTYASDFFDWTSKEFDQSSKYEVANKLSREKTITIRMHNTATYQDYVIGIVVLSIVTISMYFIVLIALALYHRKSAPLTLNAVDLIHGEPEGVNGERNQQLGQSVLDIAAANYGIRSRDADSIDGQLEPLKQIYLNELCTRDTTTLSAQSNMYFWHLVTVAVFYGLPVIQLVIMHQRVLNNTGNQDQCYYNFLCAHPLGLFSDFNHIFSNIGYILLGLLFILIVWRRHKAHCDPEFDASYGIPQHYGLYYAMGGALIMEGVLSASYHVCPSHVNFQFDTSFMYVIAVLCMLNIYQCRHPDINASAHVTFGVLAVTVFIGLMGVIFPNFYFWLLFTIIHITTCLLLSLQVYYMGRLKVDRFCCKECVCGGILRPAFRTRMIMIIIGNLCNWSLAGFGLYMHSKDFATHLLNLFLMNLALYMFWYLIMKLVHKERPRWYTWIIFIMASLSWGGGLRFFFDTSTKWSLTPAQSRVYNQQCVIMNFYDNHDIWHILSASAMFFSFMFFLTMDDDISHIPRYKIPVF